MPGTPTPAKPEPLTVLQLVTLLLSVYVLVALFVQSAFNLTPEAHALLDRVDFYVCFVFMADFVVRFRRAPSKLAFMRWGWIDLLSSIPVIEPLRVGRLVRIIRILRILRALRSSRNVLGYLLKRRRTSSLAAVGSIVFILVFFASIAVLQFEDSPEANIKTPADALWWAFSTITTVGYGDRFPLSVEGRLVACLLMTAGVGLFGTVTGFVASLFVETEIEKEDTDIKSLTREIHALRDQISALETRLDGAREPKPPPKASDSLP